MTNNPKATSGGRFRPDERMLYFAASSAVASFRSLTHYKHALFAVNFLPRSAQQEGSTLDETIREGTVALIDSGVFSVTSEHARAAQITFYEALKLPDHEITGFADIQDRYLGIVLPRKETIWGAIEIDQGGPNAKTLRREAMEREHGFTPMPVYHALTDGLDYFHELASQYDRIAVANVVSSTTEVRAEILRSLTERRRQYPGLKWIHLLGYSPDVLTNAYHFESADSSSYLEGMRFGFSRVRALNVPFSRWPQEFLPNPANSVQRKTQVALVGKELQYEQESWVHYRQELAKHHIEKETYT